MMTPWIKRTFIGLFGASVLFGGLAACSHRGHADGTWQGSEADAARFKTKMVDRVGKELDLDPAQKQKVRDFMGKRHGWRS